ATCGGPTGRARWSPRPEAATSGRRRPVRGPDRPSPVRPVQGPCGDGPSEVRGQEGQGGPTAGTTGKKGRHGPRLVTVRCVSPGDGIRDGFSSGRRSG